MQNLNLKAFGGLLFLELALAVALFWPAGTLAYWQAWVFLAVFGITVAAITYYLMLHDPKLLERRVEAGPAAEKQRSQQVIQSLAQVAFIIIFILPALDYRNHWSDVPLLVNLLGDALVALGLYWVFLVFKENTFTSATIAVGEGQKVIDTGPYAAMRHPMYSGALLMLLGVPLALGSWWGLLTLVPITVVIIVRLLDEEKFLDKNLAGYAEYRQKVKYRLIPFIW